MDENLILGIAIAVGLWIFLRRRQQSEGGRRIGLFGWSAPPRPGGLQPVRPSQRRQETMPRVGTPGTVTPDQLRALEAHSFAPDKGWSREEADLILDSVAYLRAVCAETTGNAQPDLEVQNEILRTILLDQDLRDYVRAWGERRREAGEADHNPSPLPRNNQFERVAEAARDLTQD
ncbi:MAG TPA: hypothetical protein VGB90_05530 [Alphaproteobacteria bacterium]